MAIPANPTNLKAVYSHVSQSVTLTWTAAANVAEYQIQRWSSLTGYYEGRGTAPGTVNYFIDDSNLLAGVSYAYRILSKNADGNPSTFSKPSNTVTIIDPAAPVTGVEAERDPLTGRVNIVWTNNETDRAPYDYHYIHRWNNVTKVYEGINRIAGSQESYIDYNPPADRGLQYKILTSNTPNWSLAAYSRPSGVVYTVPLAPTTVTAKWVGNDIAISWAMPSTIGTTVQLEHSVDGVEWDPLASLGKVTAYKHTTPERGSSHRYRVSTMSPDPAVGVATQSAWASSNIVYAQTSPNPPTILGPAYAPTREAFRMSFLHNPTSPDSPLGGVQLRYRAAGTSTWSATVSGDTVPAQAGTGAIEVSMATRTPNSGFGLWSDPVVIRLRARPSLTVTAPTEGATITGPALPAAWTSTNQAKWQAELSIGATVVGANEGITEKSTVFTVKNGTSYTVRIRVHDGYLWSNWVSRSVTTKFSTVGAVTVSAVVDIEPATIALTATGPVSVVRYEVLRRVEGGLWVSLGNMLNKSMTDTLPPLRTNLEYMVIGWTSNGSASSSVAVLTRVEKIAVMINFGPGYQNVTEVTCGFKDVQVTTERDAVLHHFAGRSLPVEVLGGEFSRVAAVSGVIYNMKGELVAANAEWDDVIASDQKWYRDFTGLSFKASIASINVNRGYRLSEVSFRAEEIGS